MKAWQMNRLGDPWSELKLAEVESPALPEGGVRIKVEAADLNFADILQCQGNYQVRLEPPFTPGMCSAGVVVESSCDQLAEGQRVVGMNWENYGGFAEEAVLVGEDTYVIPDSVSAIAAAGAHVTYATAWFALQRRGRLQAGETLLVLAGAGGVGSAAIDMARDIGAYVIAAAGGAEKCGQCLQLGADQVIDYRNEDLYAEVKRLTDGRGVDVVFDPVGGEWFNIARRLLAWEGRLLVIGFASGDIPQAPANHALVKNYSIVGVHMGGYRTADRTPLARCFSDIHGQISTGKLNPLVSEVIAMTDLPAALHRLANRETVGRVVLNPLALG